MFKVTSQQVQLRSIEDCTRDKIYIRYRTNNPFDKLEIAVLGMFDLSSDIKFVWSKIKPTTMFRYTGTSFNFDTIKEAIEYSINNNWHVLGFDHVGELHEFLTSIDFYKEDKCI